MHRLLLLILSSLILVDCSTEPDETDNLPEGHTYSIVQDLEWVRPGGHALTMDIYTPETNQENYPVLVIFHGGGWLINDKTTMTAMSEYIATNSQYVICNVNYRLLVDEENTITMNQIIEDAMGAVVWVKENIATYQGDPAKIMVTGDSAGGHLAAMILLAGDQLESDGFSGVSLGFKPTYLPAGESAESIASTSGLDVQGAILSYAALDIAAACRAGGLESSSNIFWSLAGARPRGIFGDSINIDNDPQFYDAVSPQALIPASTEKLLPPVLCTVGSADFLVPPSSVEAFVNLMTENGHSAEFWIHEGRNHAFLDGGGNAFLGTEFERDAIPAITKMISFMDEVFYSNQE
ncbi:MAG: alpha/beta hydrolase [Candidatus Marinimicrobia bacterium]|nr:alpha/beta hydrolase [Candidatus Neomarinimicrobiota bacterium]MCF7922946.1 alpha/beta hydrolase [Candidatus Neomarinimicrobiota bacterium]